MDFELDAESVRRSVPPVDYVLQPHEHLGDPNQVNISRCHTKRK